MGKQKKNQTNEAFNLHSSRNTHPEWAQNAVIYEVNIRQYTPEGTFRAFEAHLPRLQRLGVDILWFMPIHPISKQGRQGTLGSYYAVQDYTNVNPEFGTMDDFKQLVRKAHDLGFNVLLDWVGNHTGWDHHWIHAHPEWYTKDSNGNIVHPPGTNWKDVADLNFTNRHMREAMLEAMIFWVKEVDVDGFRADYAYGVPLEFWETARETLQRIKPIYMLAEDDKLPELMHQAFHSNYGWELHHVMNDIAKSKKNATHIHQCVERVERTYPQGAYPMQFTSNHDENSQAGTEFERLGDAVKTMAVLSFTVPGIPLIYSGQEAGMDKRLLFFDKDEIDWTDLSMHTFYERLIRLKKENPALWNGSAGGSITFIETPDKRVLVFQRQKGNNIVHVMMNVSADDLSVEMISAGIPIEWIDVDRAVLYSGSVIDFTEEGILHLSPWEYIVVTNQCMSKHE